MHFPVTQRSRFDVSHIDKERENRLTESQQSSQEQAFLREKVPLSDRERMEEREAPLVIIGWREWVSLPEIGISRIKAKIDTGARSSSLHAFDIQRFEQEGRSFVRFNVHPVQRREDISVLCEAEIHDVRNVKSSSGESSDRIVIQTPVSWMGETWIVDLTLADRTQMGFRMLVGREAVRGRMLVDPGRSYFGGRPRKKRRKR